MTGEDRRPLTRERILVEAVRFVDEHGLDALSMRKLGAALGVEAMSLYNHVTDKDELLDGMLGQVLSEVPLPGRSLPWRSQISQLAHGFRDTAHRHPNIFPLLAERPLRSSGGIERAEREYEVLRDAGLQPEEALGAMFAATSFVLGYVTTELNAMGRGAPLGRQSRRDAGDAGDAGDGGKGGDGGDHGADRTAQSYRREFGEGFDAGDPEREFEFGLELIFSGIAHLLRSRSSPPQIDP